MDDEVGVDTDDLDIYNNLPLPLPGYRPPG